VNSSSNFSKIRAAAGVGLMSAALGGCYLLESAQGQLELMAQREPIAALIKNPATRPALRRQLEEVTAIRDFASRELKLPDNGSYRQYADVGRPYVVWNVVAAPEFSVEPKKWCFPVVGCVAYRGYFAERRAVAFAANLRARHFDVSVGGVAAYSTLGHFDDPILSTMVGWDDVELAAIVFHELTHQLLYVSGDAPFNEALASLVEEEGVRRWLLAQERAADLARYRTQQQRYLEIVDLLRTTRDELSRVYAAPIDSDAMRQMKQMTFANLRTEYARRKAAWGGHAPFDLWFAAEINNAHLASVATYSDCLPGLRRELVAADGNLAVFYQRARALAALKSDVRAAAVCAG